MNGGKLRITNRGVSRASITQWQPTLTVHDPNPPITLESPAALTVYRDLTPISPGYGFQPFNVAY